MRRPSLLLALAALAALSAPFATSARAGETANVRLVLAGVVDGRVDAGLAIDLPEGWKTYWRAPGDAGIPPSIETEASSGLTRPVVRFPTPERFLEADLTAIGYTRSVVLPIDTALADPKRPGGLDVHVMIGLCHDICVPFETRVQAVIDPAAPRDGAAAALLAAARARLPVAHRAGSTPAVESVTVEAGAEGPQAVVTVAMPEGDAAAHDLFVEGPTPDWALPQPTRRGAGGARETWVFPVDGLPKGAAFAGSTLAFTIKAGDRAVEQSVRVDAGPVAP